MIPETLSALIPEMLSDEQEEILITLRALAGLVAQALRRKVALDPASDAFAVARANVEIYFWRDLLLYHTRRLLPRVVGQDGIPACRQFAEDLVRTVYLEDRAAIAQHGCDPPTCTHPAHRRGQPCASPYGPPRRAD